MPKGGQLPRPAPALNVGWPMEKMTQKTVCGWPVMCATSGTMEFAHMSHKRCWTWLKRKAPGSVTIAGLLGDFLHLTCLLQDPRTAHKPKA